MAIFNLKLGTQLKTRGHNIHPSSNQTRQRAHSTITENINASSKANKVHNKEVKSESNPHLSPFIYKSKILPLVKTNLFPHCAKRGKWSILSV